MKKIVLVLLFLFVAGLVFSNTFFNTFKEKGLSDEKLPEGVMTSSVIKVSDAVFYSFLDETSHPYVLKLSGINTECISSAKFCLREAANHFVQNLLNVSGEELYFVKEGKDNALIWMKYEEGYYLLNLMLLYYDYAFIEGESELLAPYLERYDKIEAKENGFVNVLGDHD